MAEIRDGLTPDVKSLFILAGMIRAKTEKGEWILGERDGLVDALKIARDAMDLPPSRHRDKIDHVLLAMQAQRNEPQPETDQPRKELK